MVRCADLVGRAPPRRHWTGSVGPALPKAPHASNHAVSLRCREPIRSMASPWNREDPLHVEETRVIIREINVRTRTHFKVMTEMQGRFVYEDGKTPGRLLLCEFLDNSIYALQRSAFLANTIKPFPTYEPIEVHIFYRHPCAWPCQHFHTNDGERVPELIAVLDRGPGMDEKALGGAHAMWPFEATRGLDLHM
eukprot:6181669-Pleurochrysis_carterae.AAC.3